MALTKVLRGGLSTGISDSSDATAMTISSDEDVMIGTTDESSGAKFIVGSTDDDKRAFIQGSNQYRLGLKNGSNNHVWLGSGGADNFRVSNSSGSTLFELNSSGNIVLPSSNAGIHLGVTSATASNLLDDYEEGTWTPTADGGSTTYHDQYGFYTKIGRLVYAKFNIRINNYTGSVGYVMGGLPFTSMNVTGSGGSGSIFYFGNIANNAIFIGARVDPNVSSVYISASTSASTSMNNINHNWAGNSAQLIGHVIYHTA